MKPYLLSAIVFIGIFAAAMEAQTSGTSGSTGAAATAIRSQAPSDRALPALVEGQPVERRQPEKKDDQPTFPQQTRVPYHASAPFQITTLIDTLPAPWSLAFLPDGKILLTERLPGSIRILDTTGVLSAPVAGVSALMAPDAKDIGVLDVVLDPHFALNHQIFFTFYDYINGTNSNTWVARGQLDEANLALIGAKVIFRAQPAMPSKRPGGARQEGASPSRATTPFS